MTLRNEFRIVKESADMQIVNRRMPQMVPFIKKFHHLAIWHIITVNYHSSRVSVRKHGSTHAVEVSKTIFISLLALI